MARRRTGSGSPPPLPTGDEKTARVRAMFDTIAPRYDLINRLMTFGLDQAWRRNTVAALALPADALVLDLACGTGDLSRLALRPRLPGRRHGPERRHARRQRRGHPARRGGRQPAALRRRRLRRARLRLRPAQFHRPGRHARRVGPRPAPGRKAGRARGGHAQLPRSGAPATTSGSPRPSPRSGRRSRTGTPTGTCRSRSPTCPPRPSCEPCCARRGSPPWGSGPWPAA